jgi:hypothetical protein
VRGCAVTSFSLLDSERKEMEMEDGRWRFGGGEIGRGLRYFNLHGNRPSGGLPDWPKAEAEAEAEVKVG